MYLGRSCKGYYNQAYISIIMLRMRISNNRHIIKYRQLTEIYMGANSSNNTSILDRKFLKSLTLSTPLKSLDQDETQVHQIFCHSPEHHQIMLEKIRIKKNYDCPYVLKIIDSHTLESKSLCSTVIKTYIVVEKPETLTEQIQQRISFKMGFQETELWTLIYSCCLGAQYLRNNNVALSRLTTNKVFIDLKGNIKINDPDFSEGALLSQRIEETQFIQNIHSIVKQLMKIKSNTYSSNLTTLIKMMNQKYITLNQIENYVKKNYLDQKKQSRVMLEGFSSAKKTQQKSKSKPTIRVLSGRKHSTFSCKSQQPSSTSAFTNYESVSSYRCQYQNKENKNNERSQAKSKNLQLFTFKDSLKNTENSFAKDIHADNHMFPRKALFGQRKKIQQKPKQPLPYEYLSGGLRNETKKQGLTRSSQSVMVDTEPSLDGSQLMNMISYQVDQSTFVRQACEEQSEYFLELMSQCKISVKKLRS